MNSTPHEEPRSVLSTMFGGVLSGRFAVHAILICLAVLAIFATWKSTEEFWFSLAIEFAAGTLLFVAIQNTPEKALKLMGCLLISVGALVGLAFAHNTSGNTQSLLIELSCGAILFLALELFLGKLVFEKMKQREAELVKTTIERIVNSLPQTGLPQDFDWDAYLDDLRKQYREWPSFYLRDDPGDPNPPPNPNP